MTSLANPENYTFTISRTFDAPLNLVWQAWTENEKLQKWFGPKSCPIFYSKLDFREGGYFHYGLRIPGANDMWGKWTFRSISPQQSIEFIFGFSDETGEKLTRHPFHQGWPMQMRSVITFKSFGDKTEVIVSWNAHDATESEQQVFLENAPSMQQGWTGTFEQLEQYLPSLTQGKAA
ncbi:SRPBCC domain-containing protein [bacterium]|nr:SRPBCC domain-containing protein [bacterium]